MDSAVKCFSAIDDQDPSTRLRKATAWQASVGMTNRPFLFQEKDLSVRSYSIRVIRVVLI